jgi:hypothetical protein
MKIVTSVTTFNDAIGKRMSVTYSEIDDTTGKIIKDNVRADRVLTDPDVIADANSLSEYAQSFIDNL